MFRMCRAAFGERKAPLNSSPTTTALVNWSARGIVWSQRTYSVRGFVLRTSEIASVSKR